MNAGTVYVICLSVLAVILTHIFPPYIGSIVFWTIVAIQMGKDTLLAWRMTRFSSMTAALAWACGISWAFAIAAARGVPFDELARTDPAVVCFAIFAPVALAVFDRWLHPDSWRIMDALPERYIFLRILRFVRMLPEKT